MKESIRNLLTVFLIFVMTTSCITVVCLQESSDKARQILEKTYEKYSDLLKEDGTGLESIAAKISIKGGGQVPVGDSGSMPMEIDAAVEIYVSKPKNLYLGISGSLGNATLVVSGKEKVVTTIILPSVKQFAIIDMPPTVIEQTQKYSSEEKPEEVEKALDDAILTYEGLQNTKMGKAHRIAIKAKDTTKKGSITIYILDGKWDPVGVEINDPDSGAVAIEFQKLELNTKIPDSRFVPDTKGYTKIETEQLLGAIMMQVMGSMMQGGGMP